MNVHILCMWNDGRGPDVVMTIGDTQPKGGIVTNLDFTAEDAIQHGEELIREGKKALQLKQAAHTHEVQTGRDD